MKIVYGGRLVEVALWIGQPCVLWTMYIFITVDEVGHKRAGQLATHHNRAIYK